MVTRSCGSDQPVREDVLHATMMSLRCLQMSSRRLQTEESEELDSDLAVVVRDLAELCARYQGSPSVASHMWPLLCDIHQSHLNEVAPDVVAALVERHAGGPDIADQCVSFLTHWVNGFGLSIARVWAQHLAPCAPALHRVLQAATLSSGNALMSALKQHGIAWP